VREKDIRNLLLEQPLPEEHIAEERSWDTVRAAFLARERVSRERHVPWRLLAALAVVGAGIAIGVSPAGSEVADWVRDKLGRDRVVEAEPVPPAVAALPAPGRLLVAAPNGIWVVNEDGGKRRLGAYEGATWSPNGLFVGAWTDQELVALDPTVTDGLHWTVSQTGISEARWAPSGFRIAYLAGTALRVVIGNGDGDRELAAPVAPVAPAWRPGASQNVVAYADRLGRVIAVDVDTGETLFRTARAPAPVALGWTADDQQLVVLTEQQLRTFSAPRQLTGSLRIPRRLYRATALAARPGSGDVAYSVYSRRTGQGTIFLYNGRFSRPIFSGGGRFEDLVWSPDGRVLLVPWGAADQWLFVPVQGNRRVETWADVTRQFDPGSTSGGFPHVEGWVGNEATADEGEGGGAGETGAVETGEVDTGVAETGTGDSVP
jgi:hypothetical protein